MASLASLPSDCISDLLEYLRGNDIYTLLCIGNPLLCTKITKSVRNLKILPRQNENFPFSALKLPQLRHLYISGYYLTYMRFEEDETTESIQEKRRNSRLTSLHLDFANAAALFTRAGSLSLSERFPSITELNLSCMVDDKLVALFESFPKTLTKLGINAIAIPLETDHSLNIFAISKLPRTLLSLELSWTHFSEPADADSTSYAEILPPQLTLLSLTPLKKHTILSHLPSSLISLHLYFSYSLDVGTPTSLLPQNLTSLNINIPLIFDSPLPADLVTLFAASSTMTTLLTLDNGNENWEGLPLPRNLELSVPSGRFRRPPGFYRQNKRIHTASVDSEEELDDLLSQGGRPRSLFLGNFKLLKPLPSFIQSMFLSGVPAGEDLQMFPRALTFCAFRSLLRSLRRPHRRLGHSNK